jgi:hypothetical protein
MIRGSISDEVMGFLHYGAGIDSASNTNRYDKSSWKGKASGA